MGAKVAPEVEPELIDRIWALVPGEDTRPGLELVQATIALPSAYRVDLAATASVAAATLAAAAVARSRGVAGADRIALERDHALASFTGWLRVDGQTPPVWADLSGRYATADARFVQIHANFPHHASGVSARLGVPEDRSAWTEAIGRWDALELERTLVANGMICAAYRSLDQWADHPHAGATAGLRVLSTERLGHAAPLTWPGEADEGALALAGLRVLDCTRVLAGPVCGQTLAAHGADVLRVGARHLPSMPAAVMSTGFGKRNTFVDLDTAEGRATFATLAGDADVLVDAYRPGALAGRGFGAGDLARLRPGIVVVEICAFDWIGPWAGRRGFDSIIQTTTGLAVAGGEASGSQVPVHLPVQALDYATGFLAAFAATRLVAHQRRVGGSWRARLSLLRTRNWLASLGGPTAFQPAPLPALDPWLHTVVSPFGTVEAVRPVAGRWDTPPAPLGSSPAAWAS